MSNKKYKSEAGQPTSPIVEQVKEICSAVPKKGASFEQQLTGLTVTMNSLSLLE